MKKIKDDSYNNFKEFLQKNKQKVREISNSNTTKNNEGTIIITKDDEWRKEHEWDKLYGDIEDDECCCR